MTTAILLTAGAAILVIVVFVADWLFYKPVCMHDIPHTPKPPIPRLRERPYTPPAVKGTAIAMDISGSVTVKLHLTDGQWIHLAIFDSDDAGYNWRRADELAEAIKDSIKQQNTQDNEPQHPF